MGIEPINITRDTWTPRTPLLDKQGAIADWQKAASLYVAEGKTKDYQETLDKIKQIQQ